MANTNADVIRVETADYTTVTLKEKMIAFSTSSAQAYGMVHLETGGTRRYFASLTGDFTQNGNISLADGKYFLADKLRAKDGDGLYLVDDADSGLFVEDGGNVGLGTISPATLFEISGTTPYLTISNTTAEDTDEGRESRIDFRGTQSGSEVTTLVRIEAHHDGASDDEKGELVLSVNDGNDTDTPSKFVKLTSAGYFGVGMTSPQSALNVAGTLRIDYADGTGQYATLAVDAANELLIGSLGNIEINAVGDTLMVANSKMEWQIGSGVDMTLNATGLGIGIAPTDGLLHIWRNSAGTVAAHANADELVLEATAACGLSILSGSSGSCNIYFGDGTDNDALSMRYTCTPDSFTISNTTGNMLQIDTYQIILNNQGANVDIIMEGDTDTQLFYLDADRDYIGIGKQPVAAFGILQLNLPTDDLGTVDANTTGTCSNPDGFITYVVGTTVRYAQLYTTVS